MMTDPIADMLTRIRNACNARQEQLSVPATRLKNRIAAILKEEGFIDDIEVIGEEKRKVLLIKLKYTQAKKPVFTELTRVSKLGRRVYLKKDEIKPIKNGRGVAILSTSKGIMNDEDCRKQGLGGELLCTIW